MNNQIVCKVFETFFWINVFSFNKAVEISSIEFFKKWIFRSNCCFRAKNSDLILNFHLKSLLYLDFCLSDLSSEVKSEAIKLIKAIRSETSALSKAKTPKTEWFCDLFGVGVVFVNSLTTFENLICEESSEMDSDFDVKKLSLLWKSWFEFEFFDFVHSSAFVRLISTNLWFKNFLCFLIEDFEELENENWFSYECVKKVEAEITILFHEINFANAFFFFF